VAQHRLDLDARTDGHRRIYPVFLISFVDPTGFVIRIIQPVR
jgi:hypothetical protein